MNVTGVKVHTDDEVVDQADAAADLGRMRVAGAILVARRAFAQACSVWSFVELELHRSFIAVFRTEVMLMGVGCINAVDWSVVSWPRDVGESSNGLCLDFLA